jgi:RNA polymerase sigma-70 factor (ECF subfamily)
MGPPTTRSSLLFRLRETGDDDAWTQFARLYAPLVYHYARRQGLQEADSADVTQEVLRAIMTAADRLGEIHRRGSLRSWLFTVAHHKVHDYRKRARLHGRVLAEVARQPDRAEEDQWERDYRQRLFNWAAEQVRAGCAVRTWQAFARTAIDGRPAPEVAGELGMSVAGVYLAKSRVMARLKEQIQQWENEDESGVPAVLANGES